ncbi:MAG: hypothetical protein HY257_09465 [Chloroflexi bacterium]|nr:hypothetical protein [Chloroflexota bacterium]
MREVLNFSRTGIYWWGLLTASVFMIPGQWIRSLVNFLRTTDLFTPERPPFTWFFNAGTWIDSATKAAIAQIKFDPRGGLIYIGNFGLANAFVSILLGGFIIILVFILYVRATKTKGILDDLIAMILIYVVLRVTGVAAAGLNVPVLDFIQHEEPRSYLLILSVIMILLMIAGKAAIDSRVFFKVLFEGVLIWFLIIPGPTVLAVAFLIEIPLLINTFLQSEPNIRNYYAMVVAIWAVFGLILAGISIYTAGRPTPPPQVQTELESELDEFQRFIKKRKSKART